MAENPYKLIDSKTLAEVLGVSPFTVDLWRRREGLPVVKVGREWRIHRPSLIQWFNRKKEVSR